MNYQFKQIPPNLLGRQIAIGDIHGCYWTLKALLETQIKLTKKDQLFLLGDLIDKGKNSKRVLSYILDLQQKGYSIYPIRGNHEEKLLMAYSYGFEFFEEYLEKYNCMDLLDGDLLRYLEFIASFDYAVELEEVVLSHPGIQHNYINPLTDLRGMFARVNFQFDMDEILIKTQIHGHVVRSVAEIQEAIVQNKQRISIDSGCVMTKEGYGVLTGLEVNTMMLYHQENVG